MNLLRLLLGTEHRWCEDPIESAPFIIRDRAPMVQRPLLNLLRLLLLLRTEHRWCENPIESAPFLLLLLLLLLQTLSHFRGPKHARKVRKLCTRIRTGENLRLIWVSEVGVAKWLDSATYKYSAECASSYVSRTCTKIGTLM